MKDALAHIPEIGTRITKEGGCVVMLDFDGTLAPIVADPRRARMEARTSRTLAALARRFPVAVITGRSLAFARRNVPIRDIAFAGNHGFECFVKGTERHFVPPLRAVRALDIMRTRMRNLARRYPGTAVEDKTHTISLHYRHAPKRIYAAIRAAVHEAARKTGHIRVIDGVLVYNILPAARCDKGEAVKFMHTRLSGRKKLVPVFIGDDCTDEDAFKAARRGITIRVGKDATSNARYYLRSQKDVTALLQSLADIDVRRRSTG